jgi:hypothetical protein
MHGAYICKAQSSTAPFTFPTTAVAITRLEVRKIKANHFVKPISLTALFTFLTNNS